MAYTEIDDPSAYFQTTLYTGNGGTLAVTNGGNSDLQPDWLWLKKRNASVNHFLFDSVRGASKELNSNNNEAEASPANYLSSFNSDGFTIGSDSDINGSSDTHVAWQWKAGTSFTNDASATGVGSIDSSGSVNTDAGFSIITFTGTGSSGAVVAHGLGSVPKMMIFKNIGAASAWTTYHHSVITASGSNKSYLTLNTTDGKRTNGTDTTFLAVNTATFTLGTDEGLNKSSNNYIAYCFAEKKGYSKFGSYTGNGNANGAFVYTGFKPAFVLLKYSSAAGNNWFLYDNKRPGYNEIDQKLYANASDAEEDSQYNNMDFLSNGFKLRTTDGDSNASGGIYIFMAFAENPFVTSTGIPATAR